MLVTGFDLNVLKLPEIIEFSQLKSIHVIKIFAVFKKF